MLSSAPRVRLHFAPENLVHIRLVFLASPSEPVEDIGIHAKAHQLFDWPVKASHLNVGRPRPAFRRIGKVDLRIRAIGKPRSPLTLSYGVSRRLVPAVTGGCNLPAGCAHKSSLPRMTGEANEML